MIDEDKERYTLKEVAKIITQDKLADTNKILNKLEQSVRVGSLQVFQTGTNIRYEFRPNKKSSEAKELNLIRSDTNLLSGGLTWVDREYDERLHEALYPIPNNLEAYWDDLNTWITENEPRLNHRFQDPAISDVKQQSKSQSSDSQNTEAHEFISNWKMRIQAEATIRWRKQKKAGCSPTKRSIKRELAKWCRDNNITTDGGIHPSEDYIYRHVTREWDPPKC